MYRHLLTDLPSSIFESWLFFIHRYKTIVIFFSHQTLNFLLWCFFKVQIQLLFIADLRHKKMRLPTAASSSRTATTSMTSTKSVIKPGRQTVTFLLVCNLGLWIAYNFEAQKVIILLNFPAALSEFLIETSRRGFQNYLSCFLILYVMTLS